MVNVLCLLRLFRATASYCKFKKKMILLKMQYFIPFVTERSFYISQF